MRETLILLLAFLFYGCKNSERFIERTIVLDDKLGEIILALPASCDSFQHKKGTIIHDSLKGDLFDHSYYSYSTSDKKGLSKLIISFRHQPFDISTKDLKFDKSVCSQFLFDNQAKDYIGYLIERNCFYIKDRYFATEIIGKTEQVESEISMKAYTYVGKRLLNTNINIIAHDTTGVYDRMHQILNSISIE